MERQIVHSAVLDPVGERFHVKVGADIGTSRHRVVVVKQAVLGLVHGGFLSFEFYCLLTLIPNRPMITSFGMASSESVTGSFLGSRAPPSLAGPVTIGVKPKITNNVCLLCRMLGRELLETSRPTSS